MTEKKSIRAAKKRRMDHSRTEISQIVLICEMGTYVPTLQITLKRNASSATAERLFHF